MDSPISLFLLSHPKIQNDVFIRNYIHDFPLLDDLQFSKVEVTPLIFHHNDDKTVFNIWYPIGGDYHAILKSKPMKLLYQSLDAIVLIYNSNDAQTFSILLEYYSIISDFITNSHIKGSFILFGNNSPINAKMEEKVSPQDISLFISDLKNLTDKKIIEINGNLYEKENTDEIFLTLLKD